MTTPKYQVAEFAFTATGTYANPFQGISFGGTLTAPSGSTHRVDGFWDGDDVWRIRFAPTETGTWGLESWCSHADSGLQGQKIAFEVGEASGGSAFAQHGPLRLSDDRRSFVHHDGTPFFWLADTCWSGPLLSTDDEWQHYLAVRTEQQFSAVQWVATNYLAAPNGDRDGRLPYSGKNEIAVDPVFFQRLDEKQRSITDAGLLGIPVLLWAAEWSADPAVNASNPGFDLPEDQAILLARYMVARWNAFPVAWFLPGDGPYTGDHADRWKRIGAAVFGEIEHAPVTLHPNGMSWYGSDFDDQPWLDYIGYQSGHGDDLETVNWLVDGPPAHAWQDLQSRPIINLEPPYEDHIAYQSRERISATEMRKRLFWSLLVSPTAGVTYGGHGVWGWDDGSEPPMNHPRTGVPLPWQEALHLPGAEHIRFLAALFESLPWWELRPAPEIVLDQPGGYRHIAASATTDLAIVVVYVPEDRSFRLDPDFLDWAMTTATFVDPATGSTVAAEPIDGAWETPAEGDWVLVIERR